MRRAALLGLGAALMLNACGQSSSPATRTGSATLGLLEVTVSGLGTTQPQSVARLLAPSTDRLGTQALPEQVQGLDVQPLTTSVLNLGDRNAGTGRRYISATFKVRNADADGTPSATARRNLTLLAVNVNGAQDGSAIRAMQTFGGTPITTGLARGVLPTHAELFSPTSAGLTLSPGGEDLQVYSETEVLPANFTRGGVPVTAYADLGVNTVFPYGYVVRNPAAAAGAARRTLPASPAVGQYDGRVALSVVLPLQPDDASKTPPEGAKRDPFSFNMVFLIVADPTTSVTQSLEEQGSNAPANARVSDTAATQLNVLPGSSAPLGQVSGVLTRRICQVRTAGLATDVSPAPSYLVNSCP